ncbi:MAG: FadD3 family acyl-CoA ligase [Acidimicrobiia bacterium]
MTEVVDDPESTWPHWQTIPAIAFACGDRFGDAEAVVQGDERLTFREYAALIRRAAAAMIAAGVEKGDRVAVWAPNRYEWVLAAVGAQAAGAALVPINTRFKGIEASDILERSGAKLMFTVTGFLDVDPIGLLAAAGRELPKLERIVILGGATPEGCQSWADFVESGIGIGDAEAEQRAASVTSDDYSDILFTSGTTGKAKGVLMRHGQTMRQFNDWASQVGLRRGARYLVVNPFFHMFGYKSGWLACLMRGSTLIPVPVFDVDQVFALIEREKVTMFPGAPTIYQTILDHPNRGRYDLSSLRNAVTGAADIPVELIRRMATELPFERIVTGYGLTEAGTCTLSRPSDSFETIAGTAGRAMRDLDVRIVDAAGREVERGTAGELVVRGFNVMAGYLDDREVTAAAIDRDGFLHTGDIATMDGDGYVRIVGRLKDMFIVGGFNAYPAEIENILLTHPAIAQTAVIGIPDQRMGEVGLAFCVVRDGAVLTADDLIDWSRERMANYKVPRRIEFVEALPLNATGKVVKDELRRLVPG